MAILLAAGWGVFAYSARRRWKLLRVGKPENRFDHPTDRLRATFKYAIAQLRMQRYPLAGAAHMVIFLGFIVLLLRSLILWGRGFDESFDFWLFGPDQVFGKVYSFLKDAFAVLVMLGALIFLYFRVIRRLSRLTLNLDGLIILGIILTMMVADILYDAATIARASSGPTFIAYEPAGSIAAVPLGLFSDGTLVFLRHIGFWTHSALVLIFLNLLPYSKHFHIITGVPNVYFQSLDPPGRLPPIHDIEGKLEREETLGIRRIDQFSWKSILDFYTCTECGRCSDHCPATRTGKKLSPKHFTIDLRNFLYEHDSALTSGEGAASNGNGHRKDLVEGVIDPEVLWACTTCRACEQECPVFISYVDKIVDMRRYLVQERSEFPPQLQSAFRGMESNANPWSFSPADRAHWADGLGIKTVAENPDASVLFWVGCMPSFDERAKKLTRATAKLMQQAGVDFAILGTQEQCTGDPARRAGNEFLYQMFAKANVEVLNGVGADKKTIVTSCPHCFNTLLNEYPDFGGRYRVVHHSTFLAQLIADGKLNPTNAMSKRVVYHDSCYLGRYNEVYDAPRETLSRIPGLTVLEPKQTRDRGMCCGAGGAQMFKEEEPGKDRVNIARTEQLLETNPEVVASACPFCMRMLTDGLAAKGREDVAQLDIAEILLEALER
jgi:Fe-S oxidoreductase